MDLFAGVNAYDQAPTPSFKGEPWMEADCSFSSTPLVVAGHQPLREFLVEEIPLGRRFPCFVLFRAGFNRFLIPRERSSTIGAVKRLSRERLDLFWGGWI